MIVDMNDNFWNQNAQNWVPTVDEVAIQSRSVTIPAILEALCSSELGSVLDVGCGEGFLGRKLNEHESLKSYIGVDGSTKLIDIG